MSRKKSDRDRTPEQPPERDTSLAGRVAHLVAADPTALVLSGVVLTVYGGVTAFRLWRAYGSRAIRARRSRAGDARKGD